MKRIYKIVKGIFTGLIILLLCVFFALQLSFVQTWLAQYAAVYFSETWGVELSIDKLRITQFSNIQLDQVFLADQKGDTLCSLAQLEMDGLSLLQIGDRLSWNKITLHQPRIHINTDSIGAKTNLQFLLDYFSSASKNGKSDTLVFNISQLNIIDGQFKYDRYNSPPVENTIDYQHLDIHSLTLQAEHIQIAGANVSGDINQLKVQEKSGLQIDSLSGKFSSRNHEISLTGFQLRSPHSDLHGDFSMEYETPTDFNAFIEKVHLNSTWINATLHTKDIAYFTYSFAGLDEELIVSGNIKGTIAALKARDLHIKFGDETDFYGSVDMSGLPIIEETFMVLDIETFSTKKSDLNQIPLPPFNEGAHLSVPDNIEELGLMEFSGNFTGFYNDFVAYGKLHTKIGKLSTDIQLNHDAGTFYYAGGLELEEFDLGRFYNSSNMGLLSTKMRLEGKGLTISEMDARVDGEVYALYLNDYNYENITVNGQLRESFFDGEMTMHNNDVDVDFIGKIDFREAIPAFDFEAHLGNVNLNALHLVQKEEYQSLAAQISLKGQGSKLENFIGSLDVNDVRYCFEDALYEFDRMSLTSRKLSDGRALTLNSDIVDGEINGVFDLKSLPRSLMQIVADLVPSFELPDNNKRHAQTFNLNLLIKDFEFVQDIFVKDLSISSQTTIACQVDENKSEFAITIVSDSIFYKNFHSSQMVFDSRKYENDVLFSINTEVFQINDSLHFPLFAIDARTERDTIYTAIVWGVDSISRHRGDINGQFTARGALDFDFLFYQSSLTLLNQKWNFNPNCDVRILDNEIFIRDFQMTHEDEYIKANGGISENPEVLLDIEIKDFNLHNLNPFIANSQISLEGKVNGRAQLSDIHHDIRFISDLEISGNRINEFNVGTWYLKSAWDDENQRFELLAEVEKKMAKSLNLSGYYYPKEAESPLDLALNVHDFNLDVLNVFIKEAISGLSGQASGKVELTGKLLNPDLNGTLEFKDVSAKIDYLNTRYTLSHVANISPGMISIDYAPVRDEEGNLAYLTAAFFHEAFKDWSVDVAISIPKTVGSKASSNKFLCLRNDKLSNPLYYGQGYATGFVNIFAYKDQLEFDINLRTERNTKITLPLGSSSDLTFEKFVIFSDPNAEEQENTLDFTGINLNIALEITPDAEVLLVFDETTGETMSGHANGNLNMLVDPLGRFNMYGLIEVVDGEYIFTLRNVINKAFIVLPGGTISWYGDPFGADVNIDAVYQLKASLYELMSAESEEYKQRVPVDLNLNLKGKILQPGFKFNIKLPTVDQITMSQVNAAINTPEEMNRQALALLVLRRFVTPPGVSKSNSSGSTQAIYENTAEFISNQLSSMLSQISDDFDIGVHYQVGDNVSNEELALAMSTQLFNNRLILSGNFGVSNNTVNAAQSQNEFIGDFKIEYMITEDGKLRLVVYNESNDFQLTSSVQNASQQGIGIKYQRDFDNFAQFYCGFFNVFRRYDKRVKCND